MYVINKENYNLVFSDTEAYLEARVHNSLIVRFTVAVISNSDHKKVVCYKFICRNERPSLKYYHYDTYKKYIENRVKEALNKYCIEIKDTGDYHIRNAG